MFLWDKPAGLRAFGQTQEAATATKVLASSQGLYNGFLAAGHVCSVMGYTEYEPIAARYRVPLVVTGPPEKDRPVVPPEALTEVTVPLDEVDEIVMVPLPLLSGTWLMIRQLPELRRSRTSASMPVELPPTDMFATV